MHEYLLGEDNILKFWMTLESGCIYTIVIGKLVSNLICEKNIYMNRKTQAGGFTASEYLNV